MDFVNAYQKSEMWLSKARFWLSFNTPARDMADVAFANAIGWAARATL